MKKRILISIVAIALCFVICLVTTASTPISTVTAFIDENLKSVMENASDNELIPVDIWITEIDTNEVENAVMKKAGNTKESLLNAKSATHSQVDAYIEAERKIYAEMQSENSQTFLNKYNSIFNSRALTKEKLLFISEYAPVIRANLTKKEINMLAKSIFVNEIYYSPNYTLKDSMDISIPLIRADYVRDTLNYTGSGIKIGMIESGFPNRLENNFISENITLQPNKGNGTSSHATTVASIMISQATTQIGVAYKGIVPNAKLYAATHDGSFDDWRVGIEWLLSQGVHVINMSACILYNDDDTSTLEGTYDAASKWFDHVALNHSVHCIVAAGNQGSEIDIPATAYNVITVGFLDDKNTSDEIDDEINTYSDYKEINRNGIMPTNKPDLVAPGTNIKTNEIILGSSGSSYAAPHVAAIVAQLCQADPALKTKQDAMKAILTASINHRYHAYTCNDNNYNKYGAGVVDAKSAMYTSNYGRYVSSAFAANAANGSSKRYTFTVSSSDTKVRISLSWLKYATISGNHTSTTTPYFTDLADLDLYLYNSSGTQIACSLSAKDNVEIIQLNNPSAGTYTIEVRLRKTTPNTMYFGLAWW